MWNISSDALIHKYTLRRKDISTCQEIPVWKSFFQFFLSVKVPIHTSVLSLLHWTSSPDQEDVCDINRSIRKGLEYCSLQDTKEPFCTKKYQFFGCGITFVAMSNVTKVEFTEKGNRKDLAICISILLALVYTLFGLLKWHLELKVLENRENLLKYYIFEKAFIFL